jgi:hypothetical protein
MPESRGLYRYSQFERVPYEKSLKWSLATDGSGRIIRPPIKSPKEQFSRCIRERGDSLENERECIIDVLTDLIVGERIAQKQYVELLRIEAPLLKPTFTTDDIRIITEIENDEKDHEDRLYGMRGAFAHRIYLKDEKYAEEEG